MRLRRFFIAIPVVVLTRVLFHYASIPQLQVIFVALGLALMVFVALKLWAVRQYLSFSLLGLLLGIITLQVPLALLINPWKVEWLQPLGGVCMILWLAGLYIYVVERGLSRYVREKSLMRLKAEETKGIGKL